MEEELNKLRQLWKTRQITDAEFVERSNQLTKGAEDKNGGTLKSVRDPLVSIHCKKKPPKFGDAIIVGHSNGKKSVAEVTYLQKNTAVLLIHENTRQIDHSSTFEFTYDPFKLPVSEDLLGRVFGYKANPIDNGPSISQSDKRGIKGKAVNPCRRTASNGMYHTGISSIDVMCPIFTGTTMPIYSAADLPHDELAIHIATQAKIQGKGVRDFHEDNIVVIYAAMGISQDAVRNFRAGTENAGMKNRTTIFAAVNPHNPLESLVIPNLALTTAEFFAVDREQHVLVISNDMFAHFNACVEVSKGSNQYLAKWTPPRYYSDLGRIFERSGCFAGSNGSITHIPIVQMPTDDITHGAPDTIGSLSDGTIHLSHNLHNQQIYPPIDTLQSYSRYCRADIGDTTRQDHFFALEEIWRRYSRALKSEIMPKEDLSPEDQMYLAFKEAFNRQFVNQGPNEFRSVESSLDLACSLL